MILRDPAGNRPPEGYRSRLFEQRGAQAAPPIQNPRIEPWIAAGTRRPVEKQSEFFFISDEHLLRIVFLCCLLLLLVIVERTRNRQILEKDCGK